MTAAGQTGRSAGALIRWLIDGADDAAMDQTSNSVVMSDYISFSDRA